MKNNMGFENPIMFILMIGLPIFGWLFLIAWKHFRRFEKSSHVVAFTFGSKMPSWYIRVGVAGFKLLALALIIAGLADPYAYKLTTEPKYKNVRIFLLLDVSGSMVYAEDVKPNRLAAVRSEIVQFYNKLDGSYEVSLIPFAGSANPYYCPLTYSRSVFIPLMEKAGPDSAPTLGTDIPAAFEALKQQIKKDKLDESGINVVVLLTDGGKEEADATNRIKLSQVVREMASKNSRIYVVGVGGSEAAVLIKRDRKGGFLAYVKDDNKVATSQLDEEILKQLAVQGRGNYLHFEQGNQLHSFLDDVLRENRIVDRDSLVYIRVKLQCYLFALAAVLFWLSFIANRQRGMRDGKQQIISRGSVYS